MAYVSLVVFGTHRYHVGFFLGPSSLSFSPSLPLSHPHRLFSVVVVSVSMQRNIRLPCLVVFHDLLIGVSLALSSSIIVHHFFFLERHRFVCFFGCCCVCVCLLVGKSALTIRLVTDNFLDEYDPTIEDSYRKQVMIDDETALLDILDTAGQEEFNSMQDQWMRDGKGFLLVYNITSRPTFEEVSSLYDKILRTKDSETVPIVLVGNKCDLSNERQVDTSEGEALASKWSCKFYETSARSKINNEICFFELVREIRKQNKAEQTSQGSGGKAGKEKKKSKCTIL